MPTNENLLLRPPDPHTPTAATDLEGTLTAVSTVRAMHDYLVKHGRAGEARRFRLLRLPVYLLLRAVGANLRSFKNDWMRDLLRMFAGYSQADFQGMCEWVVEHHLWPGRRTEVVRELQRHQAAGRRVLIVTGMFEPLLTALLKRLPGVEAIGTPVVIENGMFSGELAADFNVGERKREQLRPFADSSGKIHTAYGDTYSDRYMLELSHNPVAVYPDSRLREVAKTRGWRILEAEMVQ